jgi:hypothetical protein
VLRAQKDAAEAVSTIQGTDDAAYKRAVTRLSAEVD